MVSIIYFNYCYVKLILLLLNIFETQEDLESENLLKGQNTSNIGYMWIAKNVFK